MAERCYGVGVKVEDLSEERLQALLEQHGDLDPEVRAWQEADLRYRMGMASLRRSFVSVEYTYLDQNGVRHRSTVRHAIAKRERD